MVLAIGVGVAIFMVADVQLALASIDPDNPETWPNMGPQIRYFFIPVIAAYVAVAAVVANLILSLVDHRSMGRLIHWALLGGAYSLVATLLPMRYLGVNVKIGALVCVVVALVCVLLVRWRFGIKQEGDAA
jgi:hypothetical protein